MAKLTMRRLAGWDAWLCLTFNRASRQNGVCGVLRAASRLGDGVFWYVLAAALLLFDGRAALLPVLQMLIVGCLGVAAYKWLKTRVCRPRPYQINQQIALAVAPLDQFSFPSGHTMHAVSFSVIVLHHYPALWVVLLPFAVLVAISRPVLGVHYPSDVLAGAALGAALAAFVLYVT